MALVVLVAGCGGTVPDVPASDEGGELDDVEYPEGFAEGEISATVAREHTMALLAAEPVVVDANEKFRPGAYADYRYEANGTHAHFLIDVHNGERDVTVREVYVDPTTRYGRQVHDGRTTFDTSAPEIRDTRRRSAASLWAVVSRILVLGEFRAVDAYRVDGERRIRYTLVETIVDGATEARGYVIVDGDGGIVAARLAYTAEGERKRFRYVVLSESGVSVAVPPWVDGIRDER